jgi:hypothetical protein
MDFLAKSDLVRLHERRNGAQLGDHPTADGRPLVTLVRGRDFPDLIIADNVTYKYYLNALQAIQRIQTENAAPDMAEAGFQSLKYLNADVVLDGGFQGFSSDPLPAQTSTGSAVGGAPSTTMYFETPVVYN